MKKKSINATFTLFADWRFFLLPTVELDWHPEESYGYTIFRWLWFGLAILSTSATTPPKQISDVCNSHNTIT